MNEKKIQILIGWSIVTVKPKNAENEIYKGQIEIETWVKHIEKLIRHSKSTRKSVNLTLKWGQIDPALGHIPRQVDWFLGDC